MTDDLRHLQDEAKRMQLIRRITSLPPDQIASLTHFLDEQAAKAGRDQSPESEWILADQAAQILGRHPGHLRRLCATKLIFGGLARTVKPEAGKPQWWICRNYDPRLAAPPAP